MARANKSWQNLTPSPWKNLFTSNVFNKYIHIYIYAVQFFVYLSTWLHYLATQPVRDMVEHNKVPVTFALLFSPLIILLLLLLIIIKHILVCKVVRTAFNYKDTVINHIALMVGYNASPFNFCACGYQIRSITTHARTCIGSHTYALTFWILYWW